PSLVLEALAVLVLGRGLVGWLVSASHGEDEGSTMKQGNSSPASPAPMSPNCDSRLSPDCDTSRRSPTCGVVAKLRQLPPDAVAGRPVHAKPVQCLRRGHAGVDKQLGFERQRRQAGERKGFEFGRTRGLAPRLAGHAWADALGEVGPNSVVVVPAAERAPA